MCVYMWLNFIYVSNSSSWGLSLYRIYFSLFSYVYGKCEICKKDKNNDIEINILSSFKLQFRKRSFRNVITFYVGTENTEPRRQAPIFSSMP